MGSNGFDDFCRFARNYGCCNKEGFEDIPNGFQDLDPALFTLGADVLGNIMAGNLPENVQAAVGDWFLLLGQVIATYGSQQAYFQNGPGRRFNPNNKNIDNSVMQECRDKFNEEESGKEMDDLRSTIKKLCKEVDKLSKEVSKLKSCDNY